MWLKNCLLIGHTCNSYELSINFTRMSQKLRRRLLQRKRHVKIGLCCGLSVLGLFQVGQIIRNGYSVLSLDWQLSAVGSRCRQNLKFETFTSSFFAKLGKIKQELFKGQNWEQKPKLSKIKKQLYNFSANVALKTFHVKKYSVIKRKLEPMAASIFILEI